MWKTIIRRLIIMVPTLLALTIVVFLLGNAMPGDALTGLVDPDMGPEDMARLRAELGLDGPLHERYITWLGNLLQGDLGRSWRYRMPVTEIIGLRAANTFRLSLVTMLFTYLIAVPLGILAAKYQNTIIDRGIIIYTFFAMAMPTVIFALINLFLFGFTFGWFPLMGSVSVEAVPGSIGYTMSRLHHLILPALTGALLSTIGLINLLRSEVIDTENADYVTTARSKGVPTRVVYSRHILKNASLPIVTSIGFMIGGMLTGAIFIENIFMFPGMGNLFVGAIVERDFAVVNGLIIIFATATIVGILVSDILMMIVDPRIRIK